MIAEVLERPVFVSLTILSQDSPSMNSFCIINIKVTLQKTLNVAREKRQGQPRTTEETQNPKTRTPAENMAAWHKMLDLKAVAMHPVSNVPQPLHASFVLSAHKHTSSSPPPVPVQVHLQINHRKTPVSREGTRVCAVLMCCPVGPSTFGKSCPGSPQFAILSP